MPPGEYTLIVKCKVLTEDLAQQAHKPLPSVLLYEGPIKVADEDVKSDIEVPAVCVLTLEVEGPAAKPDQVPSHVVLLKDGTMQGTAYGNLEDGKCKVYAAQGKYRVLVACSEVLGYLGEQVDLTKAEQSMTVKVSGWTAMKCSPGRQFQMNPEESAPRGNEGRQNSD